MRFDTADLASLESRGTLFDVIVHEMAHVIDLEHCGRPTFLLRAANLTTSAVQGVTPESTLWKFIAASLLKTPHLFL